MKIIIILRISVILIAAIYRLAIRNRLKKHKLPISLAIAVSVAVLDVLFLVNCLPSLYITQLNLLWIMPANGFLVASLFTDDGKIMLFYAVIVNVVFEKPLLFWSEEPNIIKIVNNNVYIGYRYRWCSWDKENEQVFMMPANGKDDIDIHQYDICSNCDCFFIDHYKWYSKFTEDEKRKQDSIWKVEHEFDYVYQTY